MKVKSVFIGLFDAVVVAVSQALVPPKRKIWIIVEVEFVCWPVQETFIGCVLVGLSTLNINTGKLVEVATIVEELVSSAVTFA